MGWAIAWTMTSMSPNSLMALLTSTARRMRDRTGYNSSIWRPILLINGAFVSIYKLCRPTNKKFPWDGGVQQTKYEDYIQQKTTLQHYYSDPKIKIMRFLIFEFENWEYYIYFFASVSPKNCSPSNGWMLTSKIHSDGWSEIPLCQRLLRCKPAQPT